MAIVDVVNDLTPKTDVYQLKIGLIDLQPTNNVNLASLIRAEQGPPPLPQNRLASFGQGIVLEVTA